MEPLDKRTNGKTQLLALLGNPVSHTFSPALHNSLSRETQHNMHYIPFRVDEENLGDAVRGLKALGCIGFNITVPHKKAVMQFLDDISEDARLMGAVNTVINREGCLTGYNTDADGFAMAFEASFGCGFQGLKVAVVGAGGTARSLMVKLARSGVSSLTIANRTQGNAQELADLIQLHFPLNVTAVGLDEEAFRMLACHDVIINLTSVGMSPDTDRSPLPDDFDFSGVRFVYDVIYNPGETKLLRMAREAGARTCNGLSMLFWQGILAYQIWTGETLEKPLLEALLEAFQTEVGI